MNTLKEKLVGRFLVEIELANNDDLVAARLGHLKPELVRRAKIQGVVDSGAARLVLPQSVVKKLGLIPASKVKVRYANASSAMRNQVEGVYLELQGRHGFFSAIVEPKCDTALIGAIVLEDLDFLVDCTKGKLVPRDPDFVVSEIE